MALDEGAVGRVEVGRNGVALHEADLQVAAGDARVVDDDVRLAAAADDGDGAGEQVALAVDVDDRVRRGGGGGGGGDSGAASS